MRWFWPWADGDAGPLGVTTISSGFPVLGSFLAVISTALIFLGALAVAGLRLAFSWSRWLTISSAALSLFLMLTFFGPTKLIPITLDFRAMGSVEEPINCCVGRPPAQCAELRRLTTDTVPRRIRPKRGKAPTSTYATKQSPLLNMLLLFEAAIRDRGQ